LQSMGLPVINKIYFNINLSFLSDLTIHIQNGYISSKVSEGTLFNTPKLVVPHGQDSQTRHRLKRRTL